MTFVLHQKTQGWAKRKRILSLKMTKLHLGVPTPAPKDKQLLHNAGISLQNPNYLFFLSFLWPPSLPHYVEQIQQPKGNSIHHRWGEEHHLKAQGFPTGSEKPPTDQGLQRLALRLLFPLIPRNTSECNPSPAVFATRILQH